MRSDAATDRLGRPKDRRRSGAEGCGEIEMNGINCPGVVNKREAEVQVKFPLGRAESRQQVS